MSKGKRKHWLSYVATGLRGLGVVWLLIGLIVSSEQTSDIDWELGHLSGLTDQARHALERLKVYSLFVGVFPLVGLFFWREGNRPYLWACLGLGVAAGWAMLGGVPALDLPNVDDTHVGAQAVLMPLTIGAALLALGDLIRWWRAP